MCELSYLLAIYNIYMCVCVGMFDGCVFGVSDVSAEVGVWGVGVWSELLLLLSSNSSWGALWGGGVIRFIV